MRVLGIGGSGVTVVGRRVWTCFVCIVYDMVPNG